MLQPGITASQKALGVAPDLLMVGCGTLPVLLSGNQHRTGLPAGAGVDLGLLIGVQLEGGVDSLYGLVQQLHIGDH
ncbi:hypothetical protein GCM10011359_12480 [Nesterenkonia alkaliphila]|nr:hypothetical protein GCM10011359_12480 [Nesterenkonia alkaliphila]